MASGDPSSSSPATPAAGAAGPSSGFSSITLQLSGVSKRFGPIQALDDVSVEFCGGEVHGLCGHNGAGKSTLMKVIMGLVEPDEGEIRLDGAAVNFRNSEAAHRAGLTIVDQELGLVPLLSVEENIFLGNVDEPFLTRPRRRRARARELLAEVGLEHVDPRAQLSDLLPGERKLVELAHVISHHARLMILDEPTASLSHSEARQVFEAARKAVAKGAGVVFVSHRLDEVFELCQRVTVLRDGQLIATRSIGEIARPDLVEMMVGGLEEPPPATAAAERDGPAIEIEGLSVFPRVENVDLSLPTGRIVGLAGQVGSGASDILRGLAGLREVTAGTLRVGGHEVRLGSPARMGRRGVHYVSNDRKAEGLYLDHSIEKNLIATRLHTIAKAGVLSARACRQAAQKLSELIAVRSSSIKQPVGELSGGNQQKVLVGRCLGGPGGELLLLDDPTRGVDVEGRAEIHQLVREAADAGNAVLFVSTELEELVELADIVVTLFDGQVVSVMSQGEARPQRVLAEMTHAGGRAAA
ncbi:MAG: sugar ABC transporter ATP-binding protein [Solirubrobacterales bacterium]